MIGILASSAVAPAILRGRFRVFANSSIEYSARAIRLIEETTIVDLLNQFKWNDDEAKTPAAFKKAGYYLDWLNTPGTFSDADAERYRDSGINVFAIGDGPSDHTEALRLFSDWNGFCASYSEKVLRIDDGADFERVKKEKMIGILLSMQVADHFRSPDDVDLFWGQGQRIGQLTYNFSNRLGSGFLENRDGGLTVFGQSIMERMEQVGMAVDVSHCGDQTTLDAVDAATRPILFTHAACRALVPGHLRLKTDEMIKKMAKTGGVMGIAFLRQLLSASEPVMIDHALNHFDHVRKLVGAQHLAVGSDLDLSGAALPKGSKFDQQPNFSRYRARRNADETYNWTVKGLDHPKRMFDLTDGLIRRGYNDEDIKLVLGGNAVRVLSEVWKGPPKPNHSKP